MKVLHIRNLPDEIHEALQQLATSSHRSVQDYVRALIEREVRFKGVSPIELARQWRERLAERTLGDTVEDLRSDRSR